jgi:hypothetical protein
MPYFRDLTRSETKLIAPILPFPCIKHTHIDVMRGPDGTVPFRERRPAMDKITNNSVTLDNSSLGPLHLLPRDLTNTGELDVVTTSRAHKQRPPLVGVGAPYGILTQSSARPHTVMRAVLALSGRLPEQLAESSIMGTAPVPLHSFFVDGINTTGTWAGVQSNDEVPAGIQVEGGVLYDESDIKYLASQWFVSGRHFKKRPIRRDGGFRDSRWVHLDIPSTSTDGTISSIAALTSIMNIDVGSLSVSTTAEALLVIDLLEHPKYRGQSEHVDQLRTLNCLSTACNGCDELYLGYISAEPQESMKRTSTWTLSALYANALESSRPSGSATRGESTGSATAGVSRSESDHMNLPPLHPSYNFSCIGSLVEAYSGGSLRMKQVIRSGEHCGLGQVARV